MDPLRNPANWHLVYTEDIDRLVWAYVPPAVLTGAEAYALENPWEIPSHV